MVKPYKSFWLYALIGPAIIVGLDQWSKLAVIKHFKVPVNICEINMTPGLFQEFSPIFDLALVCNPGISFGLLGGDSQIKRWLLTIFAALMCMGILYVLSRTRETFTRIGLSLIIGGAIGNGIDRFLFGAVTDFISVEQLLPFFPWVFNIADSAITIGVLILLISSFKNDASAKQAKN